MYITQLLDVIGITPYRSVCDRCKLLRETGLLNWLVELIEDSTNQNGDMYPLTQIITMATSLMLLSLSEGMIMCVPDCT